MNRVLLSHTRKFAALLAIFLFASCDLGAPTKGGGTEGEGVVGNLVDPSGAPMAGVWVKAYPLSGPANQNALTKPGVSAAVVESVQTTASGTYRFPGLASGTYNLVATTTQNGTKLALLIQSVLVTEGSATVGVDTVKVSGNVTLSVNANGLNVEGALCFLEASPWSAVSDESGTCTLTGLPPGVLQVSVSHPAFESIATQVASVVSGIISNLGPVILAGEATARHTFILNHIPDSVRSASSYVAWGLSLRRIVMKAGGVVLKDTTTTPRFTPGSSLSLTSEAFGAAGGDTVEILVYGRVEGGPFDLMSGWDTTKPLFRGIRGLTIVDRSIDTLPIELVWVGPSPTPAAPVLIPSETTVAPLSDTLVWSRVAGAQSYAMQLATDSMFMNLVLNDTALTDTTRAYGPLTSGAYFWRVRANGPGGTGPWSVRAFFVTVGTGGGNDSTVPNWGQPSAVAPALGATGVSVNASITWHWRSGTAVAVAIPPRFRLLVGTDTSFTSPIMDDTLAYSMVDSMFTRITPRLNPGTLYIWRVVAIGSGGSTPSAIHTFTTESSASPFTPVGLSPVAPLHNELNVVTSPILKWTPGPKGLVYDLTVARDSLFTSIIQRDSSLFQTERRIISLLPGTRYFWKVNTRLPSGFGTWTQTFSAFTTSSQPSDTSINDTGAVATSVTWGTQDTSWMDTVDQTPWVPTTPPDTSWMDTIVQTPWVPTTPLDTSWIDTLSQNRSPSGGAETFASAFPSSGPKISVAFQDLIPSNRTSIRTMTLRVAAP